MTDITTVTQMEIVINFTSHRELEESIKKMIETEKNHPDIDFHIKAVGTMF